MCNPTQEQLAQFRDVLREILATYNQQEGGIEEAVINIVSAANIAYSTEENKLVRKGSLNAMLVGLTRSQAIKTQCYNRFRLNYRWENKEGRDLLEFLASVPEEQTVDKFADWYWKDCWKGQKKQPPSLQDIYTFWPQAFESPETGIPKLPVFHVEET